MAMNEETELFREYGPYTGQRILEIGAAHQFSEHHRAIAHDCKEYIGLDMIPHECVQVTHDLLEPLEGYGVFDTVLLFSVLEHTPKPWILAENAEKLIRPGGLLLCAVPFQWRVHNYPDDYFRFCPSGLRSLFPNCEPLEEFNHRDLDLNFHQKGKIQIFFVGRKK